MNCSCYIKQNKKQIWFYFHRRDYECVYMHARSSETYTVTLMGCSLGGGNRHDFLFPFCLYLCFLSF